MSLSFLQTPASASLAQSPIMFSVIESTGVINSSSFQYIGELYYWTGSLANSSSISNYVINKYPNTSGAGLFDLNRIINSTLTDLAIQNPSNVEYFAIDFYYQWLSGSTFLTGSHLRSQTYKALDGYGIFPEPIGQPLYTSSVYWPLMTDGPVSQSCFDINRGTSGVYVGNIGSTIPTKVVYNSNLGSADYAVSGNASSSAQITTYPIGPSQSGFPLSTIGLNWFSVQAYNGASPIGSSIRYDLNCQQKYPNVRIKWKNRYGQFDYLNFNMISRQSFTTERRSYQPQLGTWESSTLSYQDYNTANQAYIVDSKQNLSVNSNWLPESYNDILKQLLVSDEIYWVYDEPNNKVRPMTIVTQNVVFKTGVVDKLIQYQFDFQYGQPYKLIM
jgi:hypothetical protein